MARLESSLKNMLLSLGIICLVCSALLAVVYQFTKDPIDAATVAKTNKAIAEVVPMFDNVPSEEISEVEVDGTPYKVYTAKSAGQVVGYAVESSAVGFGGPLNIMVGFDAATGAIYNTSVISHSETPGLGAKITDAAGHFRRQFPGLNPRTSNLSVKKDGGDVDAITASTISSRAFISAVKTAYNVYLTLNGMESDAVSGASKPAVTGGDNQNNEEESNE